MRKIFFIILFLLYLSFPPATTWASYGDGIYGGVIYGDSGLTGWQFTFTDTISLIDLKNFSTGKTTDDTITLSDNFSRGGAFTLLLSNALAISDSFAKVISYQKIVPDIIGFTDSQFKSVGRYAFETTSFGDATAKATVKSSADTISFAGVIASRTMGKTLSDIATLADSTAKAIGKPILADSIAFNDQLSKMLGINISNNMTFTDSTFKKPAKVFSDTTVYADFLSFQLVLLKADALDLLDVCNRVVNPGVHNWQQTLNDLIGISDMTSKSIAKSLFENISFTDLYSKKIGKLFANIIGLADSFGRSVTYHKTFPETINFVDLQTAQYGMLLANGIILSDAIAFNLPATNWVIGLSDSFIISDIITKSMNKSFSNSLSFSDVYFKGTYKTLIDNLHLLDLFSRSIMYYRTLNDTLQIVDDSHLPSSVKHIIKVYFQLKTAIVDFFLKTPSIDFNLMEAR